MTTILTRGIKMIMGINNKMLKVKINTMETMEMKMLHMKTMLARVSMIRIKIHMLLVLLMTMCLNNLLKTKW
jgi:hypothetical protein